jgi:hypothetical protein
MQLALFAAGAVLMPAGIGFVFFGWYGSAHTHYAYDQFPYLLSGGIMGVVLTTIGGFLYFGAWLAKVASEQREAARQTADAMLILADLVSRAQSQQSLGAGVALQDADAVPVVAGSDGAAIHRRDCGLVAHRDDLRVLTAADQGLPSCRVCNPTLI